MTTFDYSHQNSSRFCFVIEICQSRWGLKNNSPNLHKKTTNWRILVVVVKWRHRAIVLLPCTILTSNFCTGLTLDKTNVFQSWSTLVMRNKLWDLSQSKTENKLWLSDDHNYTKNDTWFEDWAIQRQQPIPRRLHKKIPSDINLPSMEFVIIIVRIGLPSILQLAPRKPTRDLILSARNSLSSAR